jgi:hypothetical protein
MLLSSLRKFDVSTPGARSFIAGVGVKQIGTRVRHFLLIYCYDARSRIFAPGTLLDHPLVAMINHTAEVVWPCMEVLTREPRASLWNVIGGLTRMRLAYCAPRATRVPQPYHLTQHVLVISSTTSTQIDHYLCALPPSPLRISVNSIVHQR